MPPSRAIPLLAAGTAADASREDFLYAHILTRCSAARYFGEARHVAYFADDHMPRNRCSAAAADPSKRYAFLFDPISRHRVPGDARDEEAGRPPFATPPLRSAARTVAGAVTCPRCVPPFISSAQSYGEISISPFANWCY